MTHLEQHYIWDCIWDAQDLARKDLKKYYTENGTETTSYSDAQKESLEWRIKKMEVTIKAEVALVKLIKGEGK